MRRTVEVKSGARIADVEKAMARLSGVASDTDLLLPSNLRLRGFGGTAALMQLIVTWRRRCPQGRVRIYVAPGHDQEERAKRVANFIQTDHGLFAWSLTGTLVDRTGRISLGPLAKAVAKPLLELMDEPEGALRGQSLTLLVIDGISGRAPATLYDQRWAGEEPRITASDGFASLMQRVYPLVLKNAPAGVDKAVPETVVGLVEELMINTEQWARRDVENVAYAESVRGLRFEMTLLAPQVIEQLAAEQPAVGEYLVNLPEAHRLEHNNYLPLLEMTVFDSGPGMGARWAADNPQISRDLTERETVVECFRKHFTSSVRPTKGLGLIKVMKELDQLNGLLRLRTGSQHLYRNFDLVPHRGLLRGDLPRGEPEFFDWEFDDVEVARSRSRAAGTFYTVLFPLIRSQEQQP